MPTVTINSKTIGNVLTADVINMGVLGSLSSEDKTTLVNELVEAIRAHAGTADLNQQLRQELIERLDALRTASPPNQSRAVQSLFSTLRSCFGDATAIVASVVKLAQLIGPQ
jgi:hypothetical protein